ncbi:hypothetical protein JQS43_21195 [Natronosporangium hydrolyticum]|uniref:Uncharacterized protein n=1 Tax=Natronosporangium hydrolyticum TaxID=2811111 RepID=A0A895YJR0_9ACTN|nr:hypothetical protein [Natronosporangium hydrolyticum]QSB14028.1 hypothetical protein JQS43_21195 [Natronosporangium hydrolyticum]
MAVRARVEIDDSLTFGDLYQFVDLARASNTPPDTKVTLVPASDREPDLGIGGLEVEVTIAGLDSQFRPSTDEVRQLLEVIESAAEDGDARGVLPELQEWRDRLLRYT